MPPGVAAEAGVTGTVLPGVAAEAGVTGTVLPGVAAEAGVTGTVLPGVAAEAGVTGLVERGADAADCFCTIGRFPTLDVLAVLRGEGAGESLLGRLAPLAG